MKTLKYLTIAAVALLALCSCEREFKKTQLVPESQFVAPVLQEISDIVIDANNNKVEAVVFVWSPASFGVQTQIEYSVYAKSLVNSEEHEALLGTSYTTSLSIAKEDLNSLAVSELALPRNAKSPVSVWVEAAVTGLNVSGIASQNTIDFNVTTYDPPKGWVFFPGYYNSWGDSNDKEHWRVWEVEGGSGVYRTIVELKEDKDNTPGICPLKLYMDGAWLGGADGYVATWDNWDYGDKDGNWGVPADETINIIEFNKNKKAASRTALAKGVGLIGSFSASGWNSDVKFQYDNTNNLWVIEEVSLASGDEFLIHLNEAWDKFKYGGPLKASDAVEGGFDLVQGGDSANIPVTDGGTYKLILHANRTPMVLEMVKK